MTEGTRAATDLAIFTASLRGGGAERVMVDLANDFAARGFAVDLVLAQATGPYLDEVSDKVRLVDLGARRVASSLPALVRYLRRERPRAMLSALRHVNLAAIIARMVARVPTRLVVSERNTLSVRASRSGKGRLGPMLRLMRWGYPRADAVTAVAGPVAAELHAMIGLPPERITVIYNPVDPERLRAASAERPAHPWMQAGVRTPVLLAVGRLTGQKDYPTLLQAFARLRASRDCRLVVLGQGELRDALQRLAEQLDIERDVLFAGFDPNPFRWMRHASVYVLSSRWEGMPNGLLQAAACGARLVSTDCPGGASEILEAGKWGRLVPPQAPEALALAIGATLDDAQTPDYAGMLARFDRSRIAEQYLDVLLPERQV